MDKSEKEKMITGELFNVYDPELVAERERLDNRLKP